MKREGENSSLTPTKEGGGGDGAFIFRNIHFMM